MNTKGRSSGRHSASPVPRRGRANSGGGGRCAGCLLGDRLAQLDADLVARIPLRVLAEKYAISKSSIARHRPHVIKSLVTLHGPVSIIPSSNGAVVSSDDVAAEARRLYDLCRAALEVAMEGGNILQQSLAAREARGSLELLGRQIDRLEQRRVVAVIDLQRSQEWVDVRTVVMDVLRNHPQLKLAISNRLQLLELPSPNGHHETEP